jgi:uncharacterized protein YndB with AHSA1/START domain
MRDLLADIDAARRAVADATLDGEPFHVVELRRSYPTTAADLWEACTGAERVARWFLPLSGDLRAGGRFQLEGNAGGTILACDPPRTLEVTWEYGDAKPSRLQLELLPEGTATTLVLRHLVPDDPHWAEFGPGAVGVGWDLGLLGLVAHYAGEPPEMPPAPVVRRSAAAWGEAHAAVTDPKLARDAAARTSAAYAPEETATVSGAQDPSSRA